MKASKNEKTTNKKERKEKKKKKRTFKEDVSRFNPTQGAQAEQSGA